jgi:ATP-dependent protease Clp ATPase subunit
LTKSDAINSSASYYGVVYRSVGFGTKNATMSITNDDEDNQIINQKRDSLFMQADQGDLIKYGIVPELVWHLYYTTIKN